MMGAPGFSRTGEPTSSTSKTRRPDEIAREKLLIIWADARIGKVSWFRYSMNIAISPAVRSPRITSNPPYQRIRPRAKVKYRVIQALLTPWSRSEA